MTQEDYFEIVQVVDGVKVSVRKEGFELSNPEYWELCQQFEQAAFGGSVKETPGNV